MSTYLSHLDEIFAGEPNVDLTDAVNVHLLSSIGGR
jgi:hypothetical protein